MLLHTPVSAGSSCSQVRWPQVSSRRLVRSLATLSLGNVMEPPKLPQVSWDSWPGNIWEHPWEKGFGWRVLRRPTVQYHCLDARCPQFQCWVLQQLGPKLDLAISYVLCQSLEALSIHCRSIHVAIPISFEHVMVRHGVFILILSRYLYAYIGETNWGGGNAHWDCWAMHRLEARGPAGQEHHLSQCCWVGLLLEVFCFFLWFDVKWCMTEKVDPFAGHLRRSGPGEEGFAVLLGISEGSSFDAPGPVGSCWILRIRLLESPESPATWRRRVRRRPRFGNSWTRLLAQRRDGVSSLSASFAGSQLGNMCFAPELE